ncbi:hypothetical protein L596_024097 [Steinernema carpocapsae]|uniref:F-box domain-containing protein n=1 Tax=Steinernema carpocapsae TaxID=34508 RepID=A0A4U5MFY0_STECR|nr:hypothetical protein L596_024097 [Steinernema carpocapsae]
MAEMEAEEELKRLQRELDELRGRCVNGQLKGELPEGFLELFQDLGPEIYDKIFAFISPSDVLQFRKVCSHWNAMIVRSCCRHIDGFREGSRPGRICISPKLSEGGLVEYVLSSVGEVQPFHVKPERLRFCLLPFSRHQFAVHIEDLEMNNVFESISTWSALLGDNMTLDVIEMSLKNCSSNSDPTNSEACEEFLKSPHCRNLEKLRMINLESLCGRGKRFFDALAPTLKECAVSYQHRSGSSLDDDCLAALGSKKFLKTATLENCEAVTPEGVIRMVESVFRRSDGSGKTFVSADVVKLSFKNCPQLEQEALKSFKKPEGDVDDDVPFQELPDGSLTMMYKSAKSRLPVNVNVSVGTSA